MGATAGIGCTGTGVNLRTSCGICNISSFSNSFVGYIQQRGLDTGNGDVTISNNPVLRFISASVSFTTSGYVKPFFTLLGTVELRSKPTSANNHVVKSNPAAAPIVVDFEEEEEEPYMYMSPPALDNEVYKGVQRVP